MLAIYPDTESARRVLHGGYIIVTFAPDPDGVNYACIPDERTPCESMDLTVQARRAIEPRVLPADFCTVARMTHDCNRYDCFNYCVPCR